MMLSKKLNYNCKQFGLFYAVVLICGLYLAPAVFAQKGQNLEEHRPFNGSLLRDGRFAYEQQDFQTALQLFKTARDANPRNANLYYWVGQTWLVLGKTQEALQEFRSAVRLDPKFKAAHRKIRTLEEKISQERDVKVEKEKLFFQTPNLLNLLALKTEIDSLPVEQQMEYWQNLQLQHSNFPMIQEWRLHSLFATAILAPEHFKKLFNRGNLTPDLPKKLLVKIQLQILDLQYIKAWQLLQALEQQTDQFSELRFPLWVARGQLQTALDPEFDVFNYYNSWLHSSNLVLNEWQVISYQPDSARFREVLFQFYTQKQDYFGLVQLLDHTPKNELDNWQIQPVADPAEPNADLQEEATTSTSQLMQAWLFKQQRKFENYAKTLTQLEPASLPTEPWQQAITLHAQQNWQPALAFANSQPNTANWRAFKADVHFRLNQPVLAAEHLTNTEPNWFLHKKIADLAFFQQNYQLAFELLQPWQTHPGLQNAVQQYAFWHFKALKDTASSRAAIEKIPTTDLKEIYLYESAKLAMQEQNWPTADHLLSRLVDQNPWHANAWKVKARLHHKQGQTDQAVQSLERLVLLDETQLLNISWLKPDLNIKQQLPFFAHQSILHRKLELTEQIFAHAGPELSNFHWWLRLNNLLTDPGKLNQLLPQSPNIVQKLLALPESPDERIQQLETMIQDMPDFALLYNLLLESYAQAKQPQAMLQYFNSSNNQDRATHLNLANFYSLAEAELNAKEFQLACTRLEQIHSAYFPQNINFIHYLAQCKAKLQQFQLAILLYQTAKQQHQNSSLPNYQIALLAIQALDQGLVLHQITELKTKNLGLAQKIQQLWLQRKAQFPKSFLHNDTEEQ